MTGFQRFYGKEGEYVTIAELLQWVREHPLPDGRCIPVLVWGSRGSGKCVRGATRVVVNGRLREIQDVWNEQAQKREQSIEFDGEGYWLSPEQDLFVPSLEESGSTKNRPVKKLYRQRVKEKGRKVILDDGSEIVMTQAHRLRGLNGWQRELKPGDYVTVPRTIHWQGEPIDPRLVTLLAWQIAEGHESTSPTRLAISQKDATRLERVRKLAQDWSETVGINLNTMPIRLPVDRVPSLRITSVAYRQWLEQHDYEWGQLSKDKRIPDWLVSADDKAVRLFLREFIAAEGHVNPIRGLEITSASQELMQQVNLMLRRFGVWMRVKSKQSCATNGTQTMRTYYRGMISGDSLRIFNQLIGISDENKQASLEKYCQKNSNSNVETIPFKDILYKLRYTSDLPKRVLACKGMFTSRETITLPKLQPILDNCQLIADKQLTVEAVNVKDSWAVVSNQRLQELYKDPVRHQDFTDQTAQLLSRANTDISWAKVKKVEDVWLDEWVYDFEVAETHNYVASMICTHNTSQIKSFCDERELEMRIYHPAHDVNGQNIVGTPVTDPDDPKKTIYAMPDWLPKEEDAADIDEGGDKKGGIWFIDEINRANAEVLAGLMEPLGEGTISQSDWKIPKGWQIVCAANPAEVGYMVQDIDEAMIDRMLHYNPGWEAPVWANWAQGAGIHKDVVDFALRRPKEIASSKDLGDFQLPKEVEDKMVASPRSLTYFASLYEPEMTDRLLLTVGYGLIGREATASFMEMRATEHETLDGEFLLQEPIVDATNQNVYLYDKHLTLWEQEPVIGEELMTGTVDNLIVTFLQKGSPSSTDVQHNRPAQLAGRFLARLPSDIREDAYERLARSAPEWYPIIKEATLLWLSSLAQHGHLLSSQSHPPQLPQPPEQ